MCLPNFRLNFFESSQRLLSFAEPRNISSSMLPIAENPCDLEVNVVKFNCVWTINNFSLRPEEGGKVLKSSTFSTGSNDELKWCLWICPKGKDKESKNYMSLYLSFMQCNKTDEVRAKCKFSILNAERKETRAKELHRVRRFEQGKRCGFKKFIRRDFLLDKRNGLLPDDRLSIFCEVIVVGDTTNVMAQPCRLSDVMGGIFEKSLFADCVLSCGCKEFQVHKAILAGNSPVFAAMFEHGMTEAQNDRVNIEDIGPEVLEEMLRFMYTGSTPNLDRMADGLLAAADKYQLDKLKVICEEALCLSLNIENACASLILADFHSAKHLKTQTIKYINSHANEVMESDEWEILEKDHSHLLKQLYKALANQQMPSQSRTNGLQECLMCLM